MLCYRCGSHVPDGSDSCPTCGQKFALGLKPGPIAGFGTGTRRHRIAIEGAPYKSGDIIAGRFEIKDNVGAGPIGWVYKALDLEIDVDVAVKVVSPRFLQTAEERKLLSREIRTARKLVHPNIVRVYEDGEEAGKPFFTMQHLEGLTLRKIISLRQQKSQLFTLREVEPIVAQIAAALDHAHQIGAHGDVKPENIIVLPDLLKLTDFSLATALPRAPFMAAQKAGGVHRYLAPEFMQGDKIDPRADVYSLGVIFAEMLAGGPYEAASFDLLARNPDLPRGVDAVFRRAVSQKPGARFATAGELAGAFADAATGRAEPRAAAATPAPPTPAPIEEVSDDEVLEEEPEEAPTPPGGSAMLEPPEPEPLPSLRREPPPVAARPERSIGEGAAVGGAAAKAPAPDKKPSVHEMATTPRAEMPTAPRGRVQEISPAREREAEKAARPPELLVKKKEAAPAKPAAAAAAPAPGGARPAAKPQSSATTALLIGAMLIGIVGFVAWTYVEEYMPGLFGGKDDKKFAATSAPGEPAPAEPAPEPPPVPPPSSMLVEPPPPPPPTLDLPPAAPAAPAATIGPAAGAHAAAAKPERTAEARAAREEEARLRAAAEEQRRLDAEAARKADAERKALEAESARAVEQKRAEEKRLEEERKKDEALKAAADEAARKKAEEEQRATAAAEEEARKKEEAKKEAEKTEAEKEAAKRLAAMSAAIEPCLPGMRYIGAGPFRIGSAPDDPMRNFGEKNLNDVDVGPYCVDIYEYPNKLRVKPTGNISWNDAKKSCERQSKRLCSEEEWEKACKGPANGRFPYGEEYDAEACNTEDADGNDRAVAAAGGFARCKSGFGLFDMAGNVAEWVSTPYQAGAEEKTVKGGGSNRPDWDTRCATRGHKLPGAKNGFVGFRCCMDPKR